MRPSGITELHLHLEGSLQADLAIELAAGSGHPWDGLNRRELRQRFRFENLDAFLYSVRDMCRLLYAPGALERAAWELAGFLDRHGVEYAEVYTSPQIFVRWGMPYETALGAVDRGFERAEKEGLASCRILLDSVRHWGPAVAEAVLDGYESMRLPRVIGFGMGGAETVPLSEFAGVYERARSLGLHTVIHAGESGPSSDVREAIAVLGVERIAHGIRAVDDPDLLTMLRERGTPLDVAVTSNYRTQCVRGRHPLREILDAGVRVTLSTDDPSLFRTTLPREYVRAMRFAGLTAAELRSIARNGIDCSFADPETKARLHASLAKREDGPERRPTILSS
ncbi:MAG: adenosine deaminase [Thermoanaerobaculia bacterium]